MASNTYSFKDIVGTITGPNGSTDIGESAGQSEEGISYEMIDDKGSMTVGAGGQFMHSLHAGRAGRITIRLLKTSPVNAVLSQMYAADAASSAVWGQNTIVFRDVARGDTVSASGAAFVRNPNNGFAKQGNVVEWSFLCGILDAKLGTGSPAKV